MLEDDAGGMLHILYEAVRSNEEHDSPGELRAREHKDQAQIMMSPFFCKQILRGKICD